MSDDSITTRLGALRRALELVAGDPGATVTMCRPNCKPPEGDYPQLNCLRCARIRGDDPREAAQILAEIDGQVH